MGEEFQVAEVVSEEVPVRIEHHLAEVGVTEPAVMEHLQLIMDRDLVTNHQHLVMYLR